MRSSNERREPASSRAPASITRLQRPGRSASPNRREHPHDARESPARSPPASTRCHDAQITALGPEAAGVAPSGIPSRRAAVHRLPSSIGPCEYRLLRSQERSSMAPIKSLARRGSSRAGRFGPAPISRQRQLRRQLLYPAGYLESRIPAPRQFNIRARQRSDQSMKGK